MLKSTHALVTVFVCILQNIIYMGFTRIFGIKTKVHSVVGTHIFHAGGLELNHVICTITLSFSTCSDANFLYFGKHFWERIKQILTVIERLFPWKNQKILEKYWPPVATLSSHWQDPRNLNLHQICFLFMCFFWRQQQMWNFFGFQILC